MTLGTIHKTSKGKFQISQAKHVINSELVFFILSKKKTLGTQHFEKNLEPSSSNLKFRLWEMKFLLLTENNQNYSIVNN